MRDEDTVLKSLLEDILDQEAANHAPLTPDELIAWRSGTLDEDTRMALQRKLILDREGVSALRTDGGDFGASNIGREEAEASWSQFTQRYAGRLAVGKPAQPSPFRRLVLGFSSLAVAALVVLAMLLAVQNRRLIMQRDQLYQPSLAIPGQVIHIGTGNTRGTGNPLVLDGWGTHLRLILSNKWPSYPAYQVRILNQRGEEIFNTTGKARERVLPLALLRAFFPKEGLYSIEIAGVENSEATVLETLQLSVAPQ